MRAFNDQRHASLAAEELGANIQEVQRLVRTMEADMGVIIGPGAERVYIVDERGYEVPLEKALLLYVKLVAQHAGKGEKIVLPLTVTRLAEQLAGEFGVERRQELGEDVAAPERAGEAHAVLGRRLRQGRQRDLGAPHLDAELSGKLFGEARDGERQHDLLALARVLRHELDVQQQRLLERHLVATLVDDVDALRLGTDDDAHVGLHGSHQALYLLDVGAQFLGREAGVALVVEGPHREHLGAEVAEDVG